MASVSSRRLMVAAQVALATCALVATFVLGAWLTAPKFPLARKFIAVSLNGEPIIWYGPVKYPTLEMRRRASSLAFEAGGTAHCSGWGGNVMLIPPNLVVWGDVRVTATNCSAAEFETKYLGALLGATRWRTEKGTLILENGTDVLRFHLAPT